MTYAWRNASESTDGSTSPARTGSCRGSHTCVAGFRRRATTGSACSKDLPSQKFCARSRGSYGKTFLVPPFLRPVSRLMRQYCADLADSRNSSRLVTVFGIAGIPPWDPAAAELHQLRSFRARQALQPGAGPESGAARSPKPDQARYLDGRCARPG